jgi:hypothetical protein
LDKVVAIKQMLETEVAYRREEAGKLERLLADHLFESATMFELSRRLDDTCVELSALVALRWCRRPLFIDLSAVRRHGRYVDWYEPRLDQVPQAAALFGRRYRPELPVVRAVEVYTLMQIQHFRHIGVSVLLGIVTLVPALESEGPVIEPVGVAKRFWRVFGRLPWEPQSSYARFRRLALNRRHGAFTTAEAGPEMTAAALRLLKWLDLMKSPELGRRRRYHGLKCIRPRLKRLAAARDAIK